MRRALTLVLFACLAASPALAQQEATECDRLAGFAHTPRLPGLPGVWDIGDLDAAIVACERDAWAEGADLFLRFLLARVYQEADPQDTRVSDLIDSAAPQYPVFAAHRRARLHGEALAGHAHDPARADALDAEACSFAPDPHALAGCNNLALNWLYSDEGRLTEAADLLARSCEQGFALACSNLAVELGEGGLLPHDPGRATGLFLRACDLGLDGSCAYAAYALETGEGVEADPTRAAPIYERACAAQDMWSCHTIGILRIEGEVIARDWEAGMASLALACQGGVDEACYRRGIELTYGRDGDGATTPEGLAEAMREHRRMCEEFHGPACTEIGYMLVHGLGVGVDPGQAAGFSARACALGDTMGCNNLGVQFRLGSGVWQDFGRAAFYFRHACDGGTGLACLNLADLLEGDDLGPPDPEAARQALARACDLEMAQGCERLD